MRIPRWRMPILTTGPNTPGRLTIAARCRSIFLTKVRLRRADIHPWIYSRRRTTPVLPRPRIPTRCHQLQQQAAPDSPRPERVSTHHRSRLISLRLVRCLRHTEMNILRWALTLSRLASVATSSFIGFWGRPIQPVERVRLSEQHAVWHCKLPATFSTEQSFRPGPNPPIHQNPIDTGTTAKN